MYGQLVKTFFSLLLFLLRYKCYLKNDFTVLEIPKIDVKKGFVSGFSHKVRMDPPTLQNVANAPGTVSAPGLARACSSCVSRDKEL